jgi:hypothetical protein
MATFTEIADAPTAARAAALWWAEQVGAPLFRSTCERDSAADRASGAFAGMMAAVLADRNPVTDDAGAKFVEILEARVAADLDRTTYGVSLGVDYGPDLELAEAAVAAGLSTSRFPWKTHMWVKADHVTARLGYGSPNLLVWSAPGWARPACGEHRYEHRGNRLDVFDEICPLPQYHDGEHGEWQPDPARCGECGQPYTYHYADDAPYRGHSYQPVIPDSAA